MQDVKRKCVCGMAQIVLIRTRAAGCREWPVLSVDSSAVRDARRGLLSPLLFACYVNDLPDAVRSDFLLFADDFKLYTRIDSFDDVRDLQADTDRLCQWSTAWQLKLNPAKCSVLSLTLRKSPSLALTR